MQLVGCWLLAAYKRIGCLEDCLLLMTLLAAAAAVAAAVAAVVFLPI
jgi:hypothetical protein